MKTQKAGCVLVNLETKQIGLVYRKALNDYSFPKGHLEQNETLLECAVRETEEETGRKNHLLTGKPFYILEYVTPRGEEVENYMFISIDDGPLDKTIPEELQEKLVWTNVDEVEHKLSYQDLVEMWKGIKPKIESLIG